MVHSLDPLAIALLDGALSVETKADKATLKNIGLNLAVLPSEFLHTLQAGVITELRAQEQHTLSVINKHKVNNK